MRLWKIRNTMYVKVFRLQADWESICVQKLDDRNVEILITHSAIGSKQFGITDSKVLGEQHAGAISPMIGIPIPTSSALAIKKSHPLQQKITWSIPPEVSSDASYWCGVPEDMPTCGSVFQRNLSLRQGHSLDVTEWRILSCCLLVEFLLNCKYTSKVGIFFIRRH